MSDEKVSEKTLKFIISAFPDEGVGREVRAIARELLSLRTDAGDDEVHWLPEDDADTDTECRLIKMINENHDIAITRGQQLRSAREEIERLKSECDNHECQHLHYRKLCDDANSKIEDLRTGVTQ